MSEAAYDFPDQLPDTVRRQIFWIIKRHTSYTAWARAFAAFDALIRKMESLLPELAAKPLGTYGIGLPPDTKPISKWPHWWYTRRCHRLYRAALTRLRRGDKTTLGENEFLPILILADEYCNDLLRFFLGEHPDPREGYYRELDPIIPEKAVLTRMAWQAYTLAKENVTLAETTKGGAPYYIDITPVYSPERNSLENLLPDRPDSPDFNYRSRFHDILSRYPIPADLPPVPEPVILPTLKKYWWAPAFQHGGPLIMNSNQRVFMPGIYLSDPHGAICYLPTRVRAPFLYVDPDEDMQPCTWTLIWRDDRYENGAGIPEEEALYFPEG